MNLNFFIFYFLNEGQYLAIYIIKYMYIYGHYYYYYYATSHHMTSPPLTFKYG